jgi:hypothetical protein
MCNVLLKNLNQVKIKIYKIKSPATPHMFSLLSHPFFCSGLFFHKKVLKLLQALMFHIMSIKHTHTIYPYAYDYTYIYINPTYLYYMQLDFC